MLNIQQVAYEIPAFLIKTYGKAMQAFQNVTTNFPNNLFDLLWLSLKKKKRNKTYDNYILSLDSRYWCLKKENKLLKIFDGIIYLHYENINKNLYFHNIYNFVINCSKWDYILIFCRSIRNTSMGSYRAGGFWSNSYWRNNLRNHEKENHWPAYNREIFNSTIWSLVCSN